MILAAHQSHYLPWLGYLDKMDRSDIFVVLDDVQYEKNGWQNRNRIRTAKGWQWLTVPVHAHLLDPLNDVQIVATESWQKDHKKSLELNYQKASHFSFLWKNLKEIYEKEWQSLVALNDACLKILLGTAGIEGKKIVYSSTLGISSRETGRLVDLCKHFKADTYLSGDGARDYLNLSLFQEAGIAVQFQHFSHPVYLQGGKTEAFLEGLSSVDLLFHHGKESLALLRKSRKK